MKVRQFKRELSLEANKWIAEAEALKAHLHLDLALAMNRVESAKEDLSNLLEQLKQKASEEKALMAGGRDRLPPLRTLLQREQVCR